MTEPGIKLPSGADELLKNLPLPVPDFEAQAKAIEATLGVKPVPSLSDDDLFRAPDLTAEAGEPPLPSQVRATAPKSHFAEMARKSVQKQEDDGAALAKELLAATAQSRRPNAEMVERVRAASKAAAATSTPLPASQPRSERNSGVVTREEPTPSPKVEAVAVAAKPANDNRGVVIGVAGVLVAVAACLALFMKTNDAASPTAAAVAAEQAAAVTTPHAASPQAPVAAPQKRDDGVVSPEELARADAKTAPEGPHAVAASKSLGGGAKAAAPSPSAPVVAHEDVKLEEDAPPPQPVAKAEATPEPPLTPAAAEAPHTGNVPITPSSGAVSTALSSVRGGAQACLAGQTEAVSALVTFASDGHVLRVSAGGPAGACIQAALSKARIAPFAKESFSAPTTVRPP